MVSKVRGVSNATPGRFPSDTPPSAHGLTRRRLMDAAVDLFGRHSVAGTSLQMISDALGLTKSAIYHHFRTRDELLGAILEPLVAQLAELLQAVDDVRGARARADRMLVGYVSLAVANRRLIPILRGDPGVVAYLRTRPEWDAMVRRQLEILAGAEPGVTGQVRAALVMAGISSTVGLPFNGLDDDGLRDELLSTCRRTLGLRAPRG